MDDPNQLLQQLRDIQEPLPPTDSSGVLLGLMLLGLFAILLGCAYWVHWKKASINRILCKEIQHIKNQTKIAQSTANLNRSNRQNVTNKHISNRNAIHQLATILRRTLHHLHGDEVNLLEGQPWLDKLDSTFGTRFFTQGNGTIFGHDLYKKHQSSQLDVSRLCDDLTRLYKPVALRKHQ